MTFGIFSGRNLQSLKPRVDKWNQEKQSINQTIDEALADRTAAIKELTAEVVELGKLKV